MAKSSDAKQMLPDLVDKHMMLGKISNNLEKHGEDEVTAFAVPFDECPLERDELNAIFGDKYFDRCVFNKSARAEGPCTWLGMVEPLKLREKYHEAVVLMTVSGDRELEFDEVQLSDLTITFDPKYGAVGILSGKFYVRPGIGPANLLLQEHQHRRVKVTITNATVQLKAKSKQIDAFEAQEAGDEDAAAEPESTSNGSDTPRRRRKRGNGSRPTAH